MRKKNINLIILYPYPFTDIDYRRLELDELHLKHRYNIVIHDLSDFIVSNSFKKEWKSDIYKKSIKFKNFYQWFLWIRIFCKSHSKIIFFNYVSDFTLSSFLIRVFLFFNKFIVIVEKNSEILVKKNNNYSLEYIINKIKEHKLNYLFYINFLYNIFFKKLNNFIKLKNEHILTNIKTSSEKKVYEINSYEYSNFLLKINKAKKYLIYLDTGGPFFGGDTLYNFKKIKFNNDLINIWYNEINTFFDYIEKYFQSKLIIIPHPKYRKHILEKKNLVPFFNNRESINDVDATVKFVPKAKLVLASHLTTSLAHAILNNKPVLFLSSPILEKIFLDQDIKQIKYFLQSLNLPKVDVTNYDKYNFYDFLKIDKKKYYKYSSNILFSNNKYISNKRNFELINNIIKNILSK